MHNNEQVNLLIDVLVVNHIEVCRAVCRPGGNRAGGDIIGKNSRSAVPVLAPPAPASTVWSRDTVPRLIGVARSSSYSLMATPRAPPLTASRLLLLLSRVPSNSTATLVTEAGQSFTLMWKAVFVVSEPAPVKKLLAHLPKSITAGAVAINIAGGIGN